MLVEIALSARPMSSDFSMDKQTAGYYRAAKLNPGETLFRIPLRSPARPFERTVEA
jgi:hypothetical protein